MGTVIDLSTSVRSVTRDMRGTVRVEECIIHDNHSMHVADSHNTAAGMQSVNLPRITCGLQID